MFLILTYGEYDSQSSREAWEVWYPYKEKGFSTQEEAETKIAKEGYENEKYLIVEAKMDSIRGG